LTTRSFFAFSAPTANIGAAIANAMIDMAHHLRGMCIRFSRLLLTRKAKNKPFYTLIVMNTTKAGKSGKEFLFLKPLRLRVFAGDIPKF
jgi:cell division protein FtsL